MNFHVTLGSQTTRYEREKEKEKERQIDKERGGEGRERKFYECIGERDSTPLAFNGIKFP